VYQRLRTTAARLHLAPDELIDRLLVTDALADQGDAEIAMPPAGSPEARAAFERLITLFADLSIPDIDRVLDDPTMRLDTLPFADESA
jgi:hypothetical protein